MADYGGGSILSGDPEQQSGDFEQPIIANVVDTPSGQKVKSIITPETYSYDDYNYDTMKGPCPYGFHVPHKEEWEGLKTIMDGLSLTNGNDWKINLHLPPAGRRDFSMSSADAVDQKYIGSYWSSTYSGYNDAYYIYCASSVSVRKGSRSNGFSIRGFKDSYAEPNDSWIVVQGTLYSAGIFWNQSEGLISITDGIGGYTIMDKNLGATIVYNNGDELTQDNMGNKYQWGNNYGFPSTGSVKTSYTGADTRGYGPGNYYESDVFIIQLSNWSIVTNNDLRGGESGVVHKEEHVQTNGVHIICPQK